MSRLLSFQHYWPKEFSPVYHNFFHCVIIEIKGKYSNTGMHSYNVQQSVWCKKYKQDERRGPSIWPPRNVALRQKAKELLTKAFKVFTWQALMDVKNRLCISPGITQLLKKAINTFVSFCPYLFKYVSLQEKDSVISYLDTLLLTTPHCKDH